MSDPSLPLSESPDAERRTADIHRLAEEFKLGQRRAEVLWLMLDGATSDKAISARASMSASTAHSHVQELLERFGVHDRAQLMIRVSALRMSQDRVQD